MVNGWAYFSEDRLMGVKTDLSGEQKVSEASPGIHGLELLEMGGRIVVLQTFGEHRDYHYKVLVWDPESMKLLKTLNPPLIEDDLDVHFFLTKMSGGYLAMAAYPRKFLILDIETGNTRRYNFPVGANVVAMSIFPEGSNSKILAVTAEEKVGIVEGERVGSQVLTMGVFSVEESKVRVEKKLSTPKNELNLFPLDENYFLATFDERIEVWSISPPRLLCSLPNEYGREIFILLPLSKDEDKRETLTFKKELEKHSLPVPGDIVGVISGFI